MVDEFMVCVDRIIASSCFEPVNERERLLGSGAGGGEVVVTTDNYENNNNGVVTLNKGNNNNNGGGGDGGEGCSNAVKDCRICQEEDEEHEMEAPCGCNGTLKFAHRKCIQRWCNKKGDITCEICNQVFSPNYTLPPARCNADVMAIDMRSKLQKCRVLLFKSLILWVSELHELVRCLGRVHVNCPPLSTFDAASLKPQMSSTLFGLAIIIALSAILNLGIACYGTRQAWGSHIDFRDPHFLAFTAAERHFLQSEYEEYTFANSGSLVCFRSVAIIFILVLLIRQAMMVTRDFVMVQESTSLFNLAGFLLPCYVMARTWYIIQCRRRRQ
ncbi:unnamed protein product, partial [Ilex paraguariensis]